MRPNSEVADPFAGGKRTVRPQNRTWTRPSVRRMATSEAEIAPTNNLDAEGHAS
jgi:hypothetical protein